MSSIQEHCKRCCAPEQIAKTADGASKVDHLAPSLHHTVPETAIADTAFLGLIESYSRVLPADPMAARSRSVLRRNRSSCTERIPGKCNRSPYAWRGFSWPLKQS